MIVKLTIYHYLLHSIMNYTLIEVLLLYVMHKLLFIYIEYSTGI